MVWLCIIVLIMYLKYYINFVNLIKYLAQFLLHMMNIMVRKAALEMEQVE